MIDTIKIDDENCNMNNISYCEKINFENSSYFEINYYNCYDMVVRAENSDGMQINYHYNKNGQIINKTDVSGIIEEWKRDSSGNIIEYENKSINFWEKFERNHAGLIVSYKNSEDEIYHIAYDKFGNILEYSSNTFSESFTRDKFGNVLQYYNSKDEYYKIVRAEDGSIISIHNPLDCSRAITF